MLVLGRLVGEEIHIDTTADGRIVVSLLDARKGRAKLGVKAPENVPVNRAELSKPEIDADTNRS